MVGVLAHYFIDVTEITKKGLFVTLQCTCTFIAISLPTQCNCRESQLNCQLAEWLYIGRLHAPRAPVY